MLRGDKHPGTEILFAIKRQFRVSLDWLIAGEGHMLRTSPLDIDRFRLASALSELARRSELEDDAVASGLVQLLLDRTEQIEALSKPAEYLLDQCQEATKDRVFDAAVFGQNEDIVSTSEWAIAILRSACTHYKLTQPMRIKRTSTATETLNRSTFHSPLQVFSGPNAKGVIGTYNENLGSRKGKKQGDINGT